MRNVGGRAMLGAAQLGDTTYSRFKLACPRFVPKFVRCLDFSVGLTVILNLIVNSDKRKEENL